MARGHVMASGKTLTSTIKETTLTSTIKKETTHTSTIKKRNNTHLHH